MIDQLRAFRGKEYEVGDGVIVRQPTLGEIEEYGEQKYFNMIYLLCATPADRKVEIWDALHIYWEEMDEYTLFISSLSMFHPDDTKVVFPNLDFTQFTVMVDPEDVDIRNPLLRNKDGVIINRTTYEEITDYLRAVHLMTKNVDVGADNTTRKVMIELARSDQEAAAKKQYESAIVPFASYMAMQQPFQQIWDMPIGAFMSCMGRTLKVKEYDHVMQGIYSGCIDMKKLNKKDLNWLGKLK